jgi:hypothetical protein
MLGKVCPNHTALKKDSSGIKFPPLWPFTDPTAFLIPPALCHGIPTAFPFHQASAPPSSSTWAHFPRKVSPHLQSQNPQKPSPYSQPSPALPWLWSLPGLEPVAVDWAVERGRHLLRAKLRVLTKAPAPGPPPPLAWLGRLLCCLSYRCLWASLRRAKRGVQPPLGGGDGWDLPVQPERRTRWVAWQQASALQRSGYPSPGVGALVFWIKIQPKPRLGVLRVKMLFLNSLLTWSLLDWLLLPNVGNSLFCTLVPSRVKWMMLDPRCTTVFWLVCLLTNMSTQPISEGYIPSLGWRAGGGLPWAQLTETFFITVFGNQGIEIQISGNFVLSSQIHNRWCGLRSNNWHYVLKLNIHILHDPEIPLPTGMYAYMHQNKYL